MIDDVRSRYVHATLPQVAAIPAGGGDGRPLLVFLHGRGARGEESNANAAFFAALHALGATTSVEPCVIFSHEYMGMPTALAAILEGAHPIKAMREYRGMNQVELAKRVGTSSVYVSQIERGKRRPGRRLLAKLGQALGVPSDLLERDDD